MTHGIRQRFCLFKSDPHLLELTKQQKKKPMQLLFQKASPMPASPLDAFCNHSCKRNSFQLWQILVEETRGGKEEVCCLQLQPRIVRRNIKWKMKPTNPSQKSLKGCAVVLRFICHFKHIWYPLAILRCLQKVIFHTSPTSYLFIVLLFGSRVDNSICVL